jgi:regulator of protease activity HflC (stomatin/prohibitin superfamily)
MGKFDRILEPGLAIMVPFIDRISYVKSLKESAIEIPSQNAITADNVTLELDGVLYTRVFDAYKARYVLFRGRMGSDWILDISNKASR